MILNIIKRNKITFEIKNIGELRRMITFNAIENLFFFHMYNKTARLVTYFNYGT